MRERCITGAQVKATVWIAPLAVAEEYAAVEPGVVDLAQEPEDDRPGSEPPPSAQVWQAGEVNGNDLDLRYYSPASVAASTTVRHDGEYVRMHGDPNATFLVGGQIKGETHRLFQIYSAGNFVEASSRSQLLQIGETKYGKPILDRAVADETTLDTAAKLALLSFDATIRSNLSVEGPIDLLRYRKDSLVANNVCKYRRDDPYWVNLRTRYSEGLMSVINSLPNPPDAGMM